MADIENPPAFPRPDQYTPDGKGIAEGTPGMALRDWFAGQALAGLLADGVGQVGATVQSATEQLAKRSYVVADAMLLARTPTSGGE